MVPQAPSPLRLNQWWSRTRLARSVLTLLIVVAALAFLVAPGAPALLIGPLARTTPTATLSPTATATLSPNEAARQLATRPLHLPTLASGSPCPTGPGRTVNPDIGPVLGDGPLYFASEGTDKGNVEYGLAANFQSHEWGGQKTLYTIQAFPIKYRGYVLLRGHQLDGPNELRFDRGDIPPNQFLLQPPSPLYYQHTVWIVFVTYTRVRAPGCYAVQADGSNSSEVIVFRAVPEK